MKIVFTGPESTGKSFLSEWVSQILNFRLVPEIARKYLEARDIIPTYNDVNEIGLLQYWEERYAENKYNRVVCDTDLLTIIIWMEVKFGKAPAYIYERWLHSKVDLYLLCMPDIPWEADPLREHPFDRDRLYEIYKSKLIRANKPYVEIYGDWNCRKMMVKNALKGY